MHICVYILLISAFVCAHTCVHIYTHGADRVQWVLTPLSFLLARGHPRFANFPLWPNYSCHKPFLRTYWLPDTFLCPSNPGVNNSELLVFPYPGLPRVLGSQLVLYFYTWFLFGTFLQGQGWGFSWVLNIKDYPWLQKALWRDTDFDQILVEINISVPKYVEWCEANKQGTRGESERRGDFYKKRGLVPGKGNAGVNILILCRWNCPEVTAHLSQWISETLPLPSQLPAWVRLLKLLCAERLGVGVRG